MVLKEHQKLLLIEPVVRAGFLACPLANVSLKPNVQLVLSFTAC